MRCENDQIARTTVGTRFIASAIDWMVAQIDKSRTR
jgi:hypothetical protein